MFAKSLEKANLLDKDRFYTFDTTASNYIIDFESSKYAKTVTCDGSGNYNLDLNVGKYYIIIKSANRKGEGSIHIAGMRFIKEFTIESQKDCVIDSKFDIEKV